MVRKSGVYFLLQSFIALHLNNKDNVPPFFGLMQDASCIFDAPFPFKESGCQSHFISSQREQQTQAMSTLIQNPQDATTAQHIWGR
jgi:hypothetical protein